MPDVDGLTLTEWIRQDPELADTIVIVLTSARGPMSCGAAGSSRSPGT